MISREAHAALDGVSAAALMLGPTALGWPREVRGPVTTFGAGVAAYRPAVEVSGKAAMPLSMRQHLVLDLVQGAGFCAAAALLDREPPGVRLAPGGFGHFSLAAPLMIDGAEDGQVGQQLPLPSDDVLQGRTEEIARDVAHRRLGIVNVIFLGPARAADRGWVLVDAGLTGRADRGCGGGTVRALFAARGNRPDAWPLPPCGSAVGAVAALGRPSLRAPSGASLSRPLYLVPARAPGGGRGRGSARRFLPDRPIDVSGRLWTLPQDGSVPAAPGWRWRHTPGHSPDDVSLWRDGDRMLVSGDAVVTARQASAYAVAVQAPEMHDPSGYFTADWELARESVRALARLTPEVIVFGRGAQVAGRGRRRRCAGLPRLSTRSRHRGAAGMPRRRTDRAAGTALLSS